MIIVLFHVLYLLGKFVYQNYRVNREKTVHDGVKNTAKRMEISEEDYRMIDPEADQDYEERSVKFFPPAYVQRYVAVSDVLADPKYQQKLRKVVDFGCSELGFLVYLKNTAGIEEILCVDVDKNTLELYKHKAEPLVSEYLHCRDRPLLIEICEGSVTDNDKKLEKTDAVTCIELIEHLYPETLTDLPYNIFGYINPKVVVITTPNADFNVLFPHFSGFRHPDHKFEWSRRQFQDWAENIILRYPEYKVTYHGICKGPEGTEHLGACTQMAIFHRDNEKDTYTAGIEGLFKTVAVQEYPFVVDNRSDEQKILDEATYFIRKLSWDNENMQEEVPLQVVLQQIRNCHITMESLKTILQEDNWTVYDRDDGPVVLVPQLSTFSDYSFVEERSWDNEYNASDDEVDWDEEIGPAVYINPMGGAENEYENWNGENWTEQSSIIIPQYYSAEETTYLYDGEDRLLDLVPVPENIEICYPHEGSTEIITTASQLSSEMDRTIDALDGPCNPNVSMDFNEPKVFSSSTTSANLEITKEDSFVDDVDVHNMSSNTSQRLNQMLDFQAYMSTSRCSTSPEPFLLQTVRMGQLLNDDSICNQSVSGDHWMLDNTFEQLDASKDSISINARVCMENILEDNIRDCDNSSDVYPNTSHNKTEYFECDNRTSRLTNASAERSSMGYKQSVQETCGTSKDHQAFEEIESNSMSFPSITAGCLSNDQPQFTSSPKVGAKLNVTGNKRRSLGFVDKKKIGLEPIEDTEQIGFGRSNLLISNYTSLPSNYNVNVSTTSTVNSSNDKDKCSLKGGSNVPDTPSDNIVIDSDTPAMTFTLNCEEHMIEELGVLRSLTDEESIKESGVHQILEVDRGFASSSDKNTFNPESQKDCSNSAIHDPTQVQHTDIKDTSDKLALVNLCDTKFDRNDRRLVLKSESRYNFIADRNDGKTELKAELLETASNKTSTLCCLKDMTSHENFGMPPVLIDSKTVDRIEDSYRYAKDISDVETRSLVSCTYNEDTSDVQSTSVLKSEEHQGLASSNVQSKCKDVPLSNTFELVESTYTKPSSPEALETPPNSWSPEIMDSGYPNSASAPDMTPEYDLSSIAQDHISDSESPSVAEVPRLGVLEVVEVENGDLANNNRDGEGNNMMAMELNDLEDLQPLIDVLENDLENENNIYALENGFPIWLLRILEMPNPGDIDIQINREFGPPDVAAGGDARYVNVDHDEGFDSSSSDDDSDLQNNLLENEDNSDVNENAIVDNIENDDEHASNSDSGSDEWAAGDT